MIYKTLLHYACQSGNLELVEYLYGLKQFRIESKDIFSYY